MNRESRNDLIISIVITCFSFLTGYIDFQSILYNEKPIFLLAFVRGIFVFLAFIAVGNAISIIYISKKESIEKPKEEMRLFVLLFFYILIGFIAVGTIYSIVRISASTILSNIIFSLVGFMMGFQTSVELAFEKSNSKKGKSLLKSYDNSIGSNLPNIVLSVFVIFPIDYFIENSSINNIGKAMYCILLLIVTVYISYEISKKEWKYFDIKPRNGWTTEAFLVIMTIASTIGLQAMSYQIIEEIKLAATFGVKLLICVASGLIPIRLISIIWGKVGPSVKVLNIICIAIYGYSIMR